MEKVSLKWKKKSGFKNALARFMIVVSVLLVLKPVITFASNLSEQMGMKEGVDYFTAPKNTMALVISTAALDGSSIGFFGIEYEDINGDVRVHYVFPHDGDYEKSIQIVNNTN